jgi:site-specific DNA-methyltransferase (adenine-specific)
VTFDLADCVPDAANATPILSGPYGALFNEDCIDFLERVTDNSVDTVFADPPFNLGKVYGPRVNDELTEAEYLEWAEEWLDHCVRVLKPGGSLFVYNLPKWNMLFGAHIVKRGLEFRHWIAISMKAGLPIARKLYPAHYSLLYFSKGRPNTFNRIRTPIEICRHCGGEIKDYGGHRAAMNPDGVNLTDVWTDVPPVRHSKFKSKKRSANQLSTKILERVIHLSTVDGDIVLDPFGGSGTTFDVAQNHARFWLGSEIENCDAIIERLESPDLHRHSNNDWVEPIRSAAA